MTFDYKMEKQTNYIKLKMNKKIVLIPLIIGIIIGLNILSTTALEPYYDASVNGLGFEGIINYVSLLVDGWFVIAFMAFIWIATFVGLSKANYNEPTCAAFAFFMALLVSLFFTLFTPTSSYAIFISAIGLGGSIFWMIIKGRE